MLTNYTAKYTKISSGYMGQLVQWPEVITEGKTIEECRELLKDALHEMILAYRQQGKARHLESRLAGAKDLRPAAQNIPYLTCTGHHEV
jgi:predicted RNase H-like HicB family nuclease